MIEKCTECKLAIELTSNSLRRNVRKNGRFICKECKFSNPAYKNKVRDMLISRNTDPNFIKNNSIKQKENWRSDYGDNRRSQMKGDEYKRKMSASIKKVWECDEYRSKKSLNSIDLWADADFRSKISEISKELWDDPQYRNKVLSSMDRSKISEISKKNWDDPDYKSNVIAHIRSRWSDPGFIEKFRNKMNSDEVKMKLAIAKSNNPRISSIQKILYSILDDLSISYEIEYPIGPYNFDCFIPDFNLLIECHGDYWHSLDEAIVNDKSKSTYVNKYFPKLELKVIWEHEFMCKNRVYDLIKYWCGLKNAELTDFDFKDLDIGVVPLKDAKLFVSKYHYYGNIGNSKYAYGAYLGGKLISLCVFGNLTRKESATRLGFKHSDMLELTRFCIHPQYQKKNFGSWFLSRCIRLVRGVNRYKCLISFADSTYNHNGIIYKASNWRYDGEVKPSYWYVGCDRHIMHKKTLWDHAKSLNMTESSFADKYGYIRVDGSKKYRFVFEL